MEETCICCKKWEEHVNWKSLRRRHKLHFFKVLLGDFSYRLTIPRKFTPLHGKLPETVELKDPTGKRWEVKLKKTDDYISLEDGWEAFVRDHSLELGDFLVFRFNGESCFKVFLFDISGCEKGNLYSCEEQNNRDSSNRDSVKEVGRGISDDLRLVPVPTRGIGFDDLQEEWCWVINRGPCQEDVTELPKSPIRRMVPQYGDDMVPPDEQERSKLRKRKTRSNQLTQIAEYTTNESPDLGEATVSSKKRRYKKTSYTTHIISDSKRRPVTEEEKQRALLLASAVKLSHPAFLTIMRPSHVYRRFFLTIPINFASQFLPEDCDKIFLHTSAGKWQLHCIHSKRLYAFYVGWKEFVIGNNLEEGDVLVFELASRRSHKHMNVRIFRVVEDVDPPTVVDAGPLQRRSSRTHR